MDRTLISGIFMGVLSLQVALTAAPVISADKADVDIGTIYEGEKKAVKHSFIIANKGSSILRINSVKASCGCTAVGYDSIIKPGSTGKVTQEIMLDRLHAGDFRKYITVFSNAKNDSILRLSLGGILRAEVEVSPEFVEMSTASEKEKLQAELKITSTVEDLKISEVSFKSYDEAKSGPSWQSALPIYITYELSGPKKDPGIENSYSYKLKLSTGALNGGTQQGRFTIKTNHPRKPEIPVEGILK